MHLDVEQGNNVLSRQLNWNVYQGQQQAFTHYLIYRETSPGNLNLALIDSVPSSQTWFYDNTLSNIVDTGRSYMVGYRVTTPCVSSRATSQICQSNVTSKLRPVSLDELNNNFANAFDYYLIPNPNNGIFNIVIQGKQGNAQLQVTIHTAIGEKVYDKKIIDNKGIIIDLSNQAAGVYFVGLTDGFNTMQKRVVITK